MTPITAYLGLGSNLGDRLAALGDAVARLRALPGVNISRLSPVYETKPVGVTGQPDYLNAVAEAQTTLTADELLKAALAIEHQMGRTRTIRWGPRVIDIDLLLYGNEEYSTAELTVPHPRMRERAFVMAPLADLAPDLRLPGEQDNVGRLTNVMDISGVSRYAEQWPSGKP